MLIWLPLIGLLVDISVWASPSSPELTGSARAAAEVPRQIANANTIFNVLNAMIFIGFTGWLAKFAEWVVPERKVPEGVIIEPEFLDEAALAAPSVALQQARLELGRVGEIALGMLRDVGPAMNQKDFDRVEEIAKRDDQIDILEAEILKYLGRIRQGMLTEGESREVERLMIAVDNMENLADVIETDLVALTRQARGFSPTSAGETRDLLVGLYETVLEAVELMVKAIREDDQRAAGAVLQLKDAIRDNADRLLARKAERLVADDPNYLMLARLQMSFVDQMRRIYTLNKRISKAFLPPVLAQRD